MRAVWQHLDHIESYICRALLAVFVTLLFLQIVARQVFGTSITWIEELSVILFVWFAYFGASYAARMSAHNRVTFHIRVLPRSTGRVVEALGDAFWVMFNLVFIWFAIRYIWMMTAASVTTATSPPRNASSPRAAARPGRGAISAWIRSASAISRTSVCSGRRLRARPIRPRWRSSRSCSCWTASKPSRLT